MTKPRIGFIGLGTMGGPMCRNLALKQAGTVLAFDLRAEAFDALNGASFQRASSVREIGESCETILLSLPAGEHVREVCLGVDGLLETVNSGATVIDTSTAPPALARELHAAFAAKGVGFADAPVARTRQAAIDGTLCIMVGGDKALYKRIEPLLRDMASDITHCGGPGCGQVVKILNNMVLFANVAALSEALAIAKQQGLDPETFCEAVSHGSGDSFALRNHVAKAVLPDVFPEGAFSVRYASKDLDYARDLAREAGIDAQAAERVRALFDEAIEAGYGDHYHPVIARLIEQG